MTIVLPDLCLLLVSPFDWSKSELPLRPLGVSLLRFKLTHAPKIEFKKHDDLSWSGGSPMHGG